ncbi:hypothetical protein E8E13_008864 [Curvularia kusanoi]|uniref:BTB domain-containing protein n=1 Tax=Curvularia kusanoi TaxID=90978 RepID=A0A9P4THI2_CURKU|nr:hypothetical protein E8E13_008864 [Curvularia kusanoi]
MSSSAFVVPAPPAYAEKTSEPETKSTLALFPHHQREPDIRIAAGQELDITGEFITVFVGVNPPRKVFWVHKNLFTSRSDLLNRNAGGHSNKQIQLPDVNPETFQLYIVLTYSGLLATKDLPSEWQTYVSLSVHTKTFDSTINSMIRSYETREHFH